MQALDLAVKFVPERVADVAVLVSDRLAHMGRYIQAGELLRSVDMMKEALDMYMAGEAWEKARETARNVAPRYGHTYLHACCECRLIVTSFLHHRYEQYVEEAYVDYLRHQNRPDEVNLSTLHVAQSLPGL